MSTPSLIFPMENIINCSSIVEKTMLPSVKKTLISLLIGSFICDAYQIFLMEVNDVSPLMQWGIYGSIIFKAGILSVVLTFP